MLNFLKELDTELFLTINSGWSNVIFDSFLPIMRNEYVWIPLYVFIIALAGYKFKLRGMRWAAWCIATVGIADAVSSHLIKKTIQRPRPCHKIEEISEMVLRIDCGSGYSFTSSHATNHMTLAVFIIASAAFVFGKYRWCFLPWALIIGFAQIYVGVHYPFDILFGFLLGVLIGFVSALGFKKVVLKNNRSLTS